MLDLAFLFLFPSNFHPPRFRQSRDWMLHDPKCYADILLRDGVLVTNTGIDL